MCEREEEDSQKEDSILSYVLWSLVFPPFKDGLSLNFFFLHIHLYFIAIQYYALVEDVDN